MVHEYKYFAFISYKSQDKRWAQWLQHKLEYYRLPAEIRRADIRLRKGIRPIFKDTSDLGVGNLDQGIRQALSESKFLIVICSPRAAKSKWVNKEVKEFIVQGRVSSIIPFIIGGEPNSSNPEKECFPEELRAMKDDTEIKAANISEEGGRNAAVVRVIARMFDLRFDELWKRYHRKEIKRRITLGFIASLLLIVGLFTFDYFRVKTTYYEDYTLRRGMPEGIHELKKDELKQYPAYCKFEYSKGKLIRLSVCNYWGLPSKPALNDALGFDPILEIGYENGRLSSILHKDENGKPIYKELYVSDDFTKVDLKESSSGDAARLFGSGTSMTEGISPETFDPLSIFSNGKSSIGRYVYEYDNDGYIVKKMFMRYNGSNEPGFDTNGISGFSFTHDAEHRIKSITYLDPDGNPYPNRFGIVRLETDYKENGIVSERRFYGIDGNLKTNEMGYAIEKLSWDPVKITATTTYYDEKGNPTINKNLIHKEVHTVNGNADIGEVFGIDGKPTIFFNFLNNSLGYFHKSITEHDEIGRPISISFFDIEGKPGYCGLKVHEIRYFYSTNQRPDSCISYDIDGERKNTILNQAKTVYTYDANDNQSSESYFDYKNRPVYLNGAHYFAPTFKDNKLTKISGFTHGLWPCPMTTFGGAYSVEIDYDSDGNAKQMRFLDGSGKLYNTPLFGFAIVKAEHTNGNLMKVTSYDADGNIVTGTAGFAEHRFDWDDKGNPIKEEFFNSNLEPICDIKGVARYEREYDASGNCKVIRTYDTEGNLTVNSDGYAICTNEYSDNRLVSRRAFDNNNRPMNSYAGIHRIDYTYDNVGRVISEKYFDTSSNPIKSSNGFHGAVYEYDNFGNIASTTFIDTHSDPINDINGVAVQRNFFDHKNNPIKTEYLNSEGNLTTSTAVGYAYAVFKYNTKGLQTELAYFDHQNNPTDCALGYHKIVSKFSNDGLPLLTCSYDASGKYSDIMSGDIMASKYVNIFNDKSEQTCGAVFDEDDDLVRIVGFLIEDGAVTGNLTRLYHFDKATLQHPDGRIDEFEYPLFYDLDNDHTEKEILAKKYHNYLDSLGEVARHIYDEL